MQKIITYYVLLLKSNNLLWALCGFHLRCHLLMGVGFNCKWGCGLWDYFKLQGVIFRVYNGFDLFKSYASGIWVLGVKYSGFRGISYGSGDRVSFSWFVVFGISCVQNEKVTCTSLHRYRRPLVSHRELTFGGSWEFVWKVPSTGAGGGKAKGSS